MVTLSLIATARRHETWLRSASEQLIQFFREARLHWAKKMKGLAPHPWAEAQPTGQSLKLGGGMRGGYGCVCGGGTPRPPPRAASSLQPALHHAGVVSAQIFDR